MTPLLEELFPALRNFSVTSPQEGRYNCIAWAVGTNDLWWWPDYDNYLPPEVPINNGAAALMGAFGSLVYEPCSDGGLEDGFEKVAIYESSSGVQHMARQLRTGRWTSKIGQLEDIEHGSPTELEGSDYGTVVQYMRRAFSA